MPAAKRGIKRKIASADPYVPILLGGISDGKRLISVRKGHKIFSQGEVAEGIYFVQTGRVKVSVVSSGGKEAVLSMVGPHGFFGEGSLVGQSIRMSTATALDASTLFHVGKRTMLRVLHAQPDLSEKFMASLLKRNIDLEEDLCDQLFNHSEKRLARVLLKLARLHDRNVVPNATMPALSHEILAE